MYTAPVSVSLIDGSLVDHAYKMDRSNSHSVKLYKNLLKRKDTNYSLSDSYKQAYTMYIQPGIQANSLVESAGVVTSPSPSIPSYMHDLLVNH